MFCKISVSSSPLWRIKKVRCLVAMRMSRFQARGPCWVAVGVRHHDRWPNPSIFILCQAFFSQNAANTNINKDKDKDTKHNPNSSIFINTKHPSIVFYSIKSSHALEVEGHWTNLWRITSNWESGLSSLHLTIRKGPSLSLTFSMVRHHLFYGIIWEFFPNDSPPPPLPSHHFLKMNLEYQKVLEIGKTSPPHDVGKNSQIIP